MPRSSSCRLRSARRGGVGLRRQPGVDPLRHCLPADASLGRSFPAPGDARDGRRRTHPGKRRSASGPAPAIGRPTPAGVRACRRLAVSLPGQVAAKARRSRRSPMPSLTARTDPPCSSASLATIDSPRPRPLWRRVVDESACRKRSKTNGRNAGSMPSPLSLTLTSTLDPTRRSVTWIAPVARA